MVGGEAAPLLVKAEAVVLVTQVEGGGRGNTGPRDGVRGEGEENTPESSRVRTFFFRSTGDRCCSVVLEVVALLVSKAELWREHIFSSDTEVV